MAHGYLREFDEDWDRGDEREPRHGERARNRESGWDQDRYWSDERQDRSFMLGDERSRFRSHPDDHYRAWRDKQIEALDRDYEDYCREREHQFQQDFDSWRQQRGNPGPLRTGMTQTGLSADPSGMTQAEDAAKVGTTPPDPMDNATLGTTPRGRIKG